MRNIGKQNFGEEYDFSLDITREVCPLTFVRTKLLLERMTSGQTAQVRLQGTEPLQNVPRSVKEHGHTVLSLEPESSEAARDGIHRLVIRKN
jgi:TusA-related sulfurtransferase